MFSFIKIVFDDKVKIYPPQAQQSQSWQKVLFNAYKKAHAFCLCKKGQQLPLAIKLRSDTNTYYLSAYPDSGNRHHPDCFFYSPGLIETKTLSHSAKVVRQKDGFLEVTPTTALLIPGEGKKKLNKEEKEKNKEKRFSAKLVNVERKPRITTLGILYLLWQQAYLNFFYQDSIVKKDLSYVHYKIRRVAGNIKTNIKDFPFTLDKILIIATRKKKQEQIEENLNALEFAKKNNLRVMILAPLSAYIEQIEEQKLPVYGLYDLPKIIVSPFQWNNTLKKFPIDVSLWKKESKVLFFGIGHIKDNCIDIIDFALMATTERWIPVDSSYEALIEEKLVKEGKNFCKPLRIEKQNSFLPDFIVLEKDRRIPIEVFGETSEKYIKQKEKKIAFYNEKYGPAGWWFWDPTQQKHPPEFNFFAEKSSLIKTE